MKSLPSNDSLSVSERESIDEVLDEQMNKYGQLKGTPEEKISQLEEICVQMYAKLYIYLTICTK